MASKKEEFNRLQQKYSHLEDSGFYILEEAKENPRFQAYNLTFQCLKCLPQKQNIRTQDLKCLVDLKRHVIRRHGEHLSEFCKSESLVRNPLKVHVRISVLF